MLINDQLKTNNTVIAVAPFTSELDKSDWVSSTFGSDVEVHLVLVTLSSRELEYSRLERRGLVRDAARLADKQSFLNKTSKSKFDSSEYHSITIVNNDEDMTEERENSLLAELCTRISVC